MSQNNILYSNESIVNKYASYLKGKKIAIVGPAPHIIGRGQGKKIDSYDIVIRVTSGWKDPLKFKYLIKDIGSKTDILYTPLTERKGSGSNLDIKELKNVVNLKWLCMSYPSISHKERIKKIIKRNKNRILFYIVNMDFYNYLYLEMKHPQTGTVAILDVLKYDIKELYITGITFYQIRDEKKRYCYPEFYNFSKKRYKRKQMRGKHNPDRQFKYMKKIIKKDKRIIVDTMLDNILKKG